MTQKLFERCLSDLVRINSSTGFDRLCNEFPGLFKSYEKKKRLTWKSSILWIPARQTPIDVGKNYAINSIKDMVTS